MSTEKISLADARRLISELQQMRPGPYVLRGYTHRGDRHDPLPSDLLNARALHWEPLPHATLIEVYQEFRRYKGAGNYFLLVESRFNPARPETGPPVLLDSDMGLAIEEADADLKSSTHADDFDANFQLLVELGFLEQVGTTPDGEPKYRLTPKGSEASQQIRRVDGIRNRAKKN